MAVGLNSSSSAAAVVASAGASSASSSTVSNPVLAVGNAASMMLHHGHSHQHKMERVESKADISVFLKIYAVEDTRMYSGKYCYISSISAVTIYRSTLKSI